MSRRNREKRAAKQKLRQRVGAGRARSGWPGEPPSEAVIAAALRQAARCGCGNPGQHAGELLAEFDGAAREVELAADSVLGHAVRSAWESGWQPADLRELSRRSFDPELAGYLMAGIAVESRRYARATVHPRWLTAVDGIVDGLGYGVPEAGLLRGWAAQHGRSRRAALAVLLQLLAQLDRLGSTERLLPLPGAQRYTDPAGADVDQKVLAKVRALLAKAESTEFPDEAEALSAKAQELMSRYSLHHAVHEHDRGRAPVATGRRMWLEAPYPGAKALLVQAVAAANRCCSVWRPEPGFATVLGPDTELDIVELLTTSLLLQANRAMLAAGRQTSRTGASRTRSFRQSFLVAYASRIGERLAAADSSATVAARALPQERLLPVLAARSRATDELMDKLFPSMQRRSLAVSNSAGWTAGRAAADQARFDVHAPIAG